MDSGRNSLTDTKVLYHLVEHIIQYLRTVLSIHRLNLRITSYRVIIRTRRKDCSVFFLLGLWEINFPGYNMTPFHVSWADPTSHWFPFPVFRIDVLVCLCAELPKISYFGMCLRKGDGFESFFIQIRYRFWSSVWSEIGHLLLTVYMVVGRCRFRLLDRLGNNSKCQKWKKAFLPFNQDI